MEKIALRSSASGASQETENKAGEQEPREKPIDKQKYKQHADEDTDFVHAKAQELGRFVDCSGKTAHGYSPNLT